MRASKSMRLAAFEAAKERVMKFTTSWPMLAPSDDEIHQISDAAVEAALAAKEEEGKEK
jgi:hypothetical protein